MPLKESLYPQDWFDKARQDVHTEEATDFYTLERRPFFASPGITPENVSRLLPSLRQLIEQIEEMVSQ